MEALLIGSYWAGFLQLSTTRHVITKLGTIEGKKMQILELKWIETFWEKSYLVSSIKSIVDSFIWPATSWHVEQEGK